MLYGLKEIQHLGWATTKLTTHYIQTLNFGPFCQLPNMIVID